MTEMRFPHIADAFRQIPETVAHDSPEVDLPGELYIVPSHEKALDPEIIVVIGDRGTGKSFWSAALTTQSARGLMDHEFRRLQLKNLIVRWGFGTARGSEDYPSKNTLQNLLKNFRPEEIWRAVLLRHVAAHLEEPIPSADWNERAGFVRTDPEAEEKLLARADRELRNNGQQVLIVFDALERLGDDWPTIRVLTKGLLRVCLETIQFRSIRTKLFMRPDMWEDTEIWAFPDASKLHHSQANLQWRRADLYGMAWNRFANARGPAGDEFRTLLSQYQLTATTLDAGFEKATSVYAIPDELRTSETAQAQLLSSLASQYMGSNRRRGKTYTWLPTHLADARGEITPRSFLVALKRAEEKSRERHADEILHYDGIKYGVQRASAVRLQELREDYVWIDTLLQPLRGMVVPATRQEIIARWRDAGALEKIDAVTGTSDTESPRLPPHTLLDRYDEEEKEESLLGALTQVGVANATADGRINIPDLFRIAAGIGRKGGVRRTR